jgi:rod shape-determining protein MreC
MNDIKIFALNKRKSGLIKFAIGLVLFFLVLIILNTASYQIKNYFYSLSGPVENKVWLAGHSVSKTLGSMLSAGSLSKENEKLKNENHKLLSQIISLQSQKRAIESQANILGNYSEGGFDLLMAGILGMNNQNEISINKGKNHGISEGMPVINEHNVLFGKIIETYDNFSKIRLISDKNSVINVKIENQIQDQEVLCPNIYGVVRGKGGFNGYLDLVPVDDQLNQGDILITSSLENTFPKNLLVGEIVEIEKNDQNPHQEAKLNLFLDIKTDYLFVITNYKK